MNPGKCPLTLPIPAACSEIFGKSRQPCVCRLAELGRVCFSEARRFLLARLHLYSLMQDFVWTLWGTIQNKISKLDIDFGAYMIGRWHRALEVLDSDDFPPVVDGCRPEGLGGTLICDDFKVDLLTTGKV
jgi:hypothetical protein